MPITRPGGRSHSGKSNESGRKRKIFIVDDHPIVRQGLAQLIDNEPDLAVCGQAEDAWTAASAIREARPDMVLVDVSLKESNGMDLLRELRRMRHAPPALMLSMHDESLYTERALRAGARGYIMKQEAPQTLLAAIRKVLAGKVYVSEKMGSRLLQRMASVTRLPDDLPMDRLSNRELEVFNLIGAGLSIKEIAARLLLSIKTVESHREHMKDKLRFRTSAELLRFAIRSTAGPR